MAKISISMSDAMEEFVATRVASGEYNNTSEYFRDLVRRDQEKREARQKLRKMLDDAEASGVSEKSFDEIWEIGAAQGRLKRRGK